MSSHTRLFCWQRWKKYSLLADDNVPTSVCFGGVLGHMIKTWTRLTKNLKLNFLVDLLPPVNASRSKSDMAPKRTASAGTRGASEERPEKADG